MYNKKEYDRNYLKQHYDSVLLKFRKDENILPLLELASKQTKVSKTNYIKLALEDRFNRDGITIDMLDDNCRIKSTRQKRKTKSLKLVYLLTSTYLCTGEEKYLSVFGTINSAKIYIKQAISTKPYPSQWMFTLYGRKFEAQTKREAENMYREKAKDAINNFEYCWMHVPIELPEESKDWNSWTSDDNGNVVISDEWFEQVGDFAELLTHPVQDIEGWKAWKKEHKDFVHLLEEELGEPDYVEVVMHDEI